MKKVMAKPARRVLSADDFFVDQVVLYYPRVTGGCAVAVVTAIHDIPRFGVSLDIRVTDGTAYWPTGCRTTVFADDVV